MKWALEAAGRWWMLGKCCSWWTQSWKGPKVSGLLPASGEEAGCRQWWALDCKHSSLLLLQRDVAGVRGGWVKAGRKEGRDVSKRPCGRADSILISLANRQQTHFTYIILQSTPRMMTNKSSSKTETRLCSTLLIRPETLVTQQPKVIFVKLI